MVTKIRTRAPICLALAASLLSMANGAAASTCYVLYDRFDNIVYRNTMSPIDMSDQGAPARAAMRQRGEYLMVMESDRCAPVTFVFGGAGSKTLSIDEIVGGFPASSPSASDAATKATRRTGAAPTPATPSTTVPR